MAFSRELTGLEQRLYQFLDDVDTIVEYPINNFYTFLPIFTKFNQFYTHFHVKLLISYKNKCRLL